mmetsp:Transcript_103857/g.263785  ORF Transcript_103857/g.263785 Transcript_103857/m.263785 type:complete len:201 (+) Transcript_103857:258-860(+)
MNTHTDDQSKACRRRIAWSSNTGSRQSAVAKAAQTLYVHAQRSRCGIGGRRQSAKQNACRAACEVFVRADAPLRKQPGRSPEISNRHSSSEKRFSVSAQLQAACAAAAAAVPVPLGLAFVFSSASGRPLVQQHPGLAFGVAPFPRSRNKRHLRRCPPPGPATAQDRRNSDSSRGLDKGRSGGRPCGSRCRGGELGAAIPK